MHSNIKLVNKTYTKIITMSPKLVNFMDNLVLKTSQGLLIMDKIICLMMINNKAM